MPDNREITLVKVDSAISEVTGILSTLHSEIFIGSHERLWSAQDFNDILSMPNVTAFMIEKDGHPIGFIVLSVVLDEAEILTLGLLPAYHGTGLARKAFEYLLQDVKAGNIETFFLEVRDNNYSAIQYYKKLGFQQISTRKGYYTLANGEEKDALIMKLSKDAMYL